MMGRGGPGESSLGPADWIRLEPAGPHPGGDAVIVEDPRAAEGAGATPARPAGVRRDAAAAPGVDVGILELYSAHRWDEACSLLYQIYWPSILAIATRRLRGWLAHGGLVEQAEDVAIEALHRIHDSLKRRSEDGALSEIVTLRGWIQRIVQRQVYDTLQRRAGRLEKLSAGGEPGGGAQASPSALSEAQVIDLMDQERRLTDLRQCAAQVESRVGQALRLWLRGMTYLEVARELAYASLSAAQSAVQAGIQKVTRCMSAKGWARHPDGKGGERDD